MLVGIIITTIINISLTHLNLKKGGELIIILIIIKSTLWLFQTEHPLPLVLMAFPRPQVVVAF